MALLLSSARGFFHLAHSSSTEIARPPIGQRYSGRQPPSVDRGSRNEPPRAHHRARHSKDDPKLRYLPCEFSPGSTYYGPKASTTDLLAKCGACSSHDLCSLTQFWRWTSRRIQLPLSHRRPDTKRHHSPNAAGTSPERLIIAQVKGRQVFSWLAFLRPQDLLLWPLCQGNCH